MQDPNADTEWNDALRRVGVLPQKKEAEVTEDDIQKMIDATIKEKTGEKDITEMSLDELNEKEDDDWDDDGLLDRIRQQRMAEMMAKQQAAKFGDIREISASDYVAEVNEAGEGVWVVLHLYRSGIPLCELINQHMVQLSQKFPATKFLRSISTTCIPNYPDKNLPTIFIYFEGNLKGQIVGPLMFGGMKLTKDELEWMLSKSGAVKTSLKEDPREANKAQDSSGFTILTRGSRTRKDTESDEDDY